MLNFIDRISGKKCQELIFGEKFLRFMYGPCWWQKGVCRLISRSPFFSKLYGAWQRTRFSKKQILPFLQKYRINTQEFATHNFASFDDFFTRKLKPEARPIASSSAIIPADGRYLFFPHINADQSFVVKEQVFNLSALLKSESLANRYLGGTMIIARLCPVDYHRFHFPIDCIAGKTHLIKGPLYSVSPLALDHKLSILWENKRTLCTLNSDRYGQVLFLEVGATNVGTIHQTYTPERFYPKGSEKGFFSFGGSTLILLFEKGKIQLASDLINHDGLEIYCQMGQSLIDKLNMG